MKTHKITLSIVLLSAFIMGCGHKNSSAAGSAADTGKVNKTTKADTAIVPANQKNVKNDSLSGDPSSKGSSDPNAQLPKK